VTVTIRPAEGEELTALIDASRAMYAADMVENAGLDVESARKKAEADFESALKLPTQRFYVVEEDGSPVGRLWLADRETEAGATLFVYDITIDAQHRGRGLGRAAMDVAEREARARGQSRVELNVHGGNAVARGLYRSRGYEEVAVYMRKELG
jgi:ribosomal protein S18 acetylase RimI-like enzyme